MSFAALIRQGLQLADNLTGSLQDTVMYKPWQGEDKYGDPTFGTPQPIKAIVERNAKLKFEFEGKVLEYSHLIYILRPLPPNGAAGRIEPLDPRDVFTLSDGSTGKTADVSTLMDPAISAGYYHIVALGA